MIHTKIVSFVLFVGCMNNVCFASEEFLKHEQLKKDFKLTSFMSLPPDPQYDVLEFLKPDEDKFREQLDNYNSRRLQELLVAEFFYNHAKIYDERFEKRQGVTGFSIKQEDSHLSTVGVFNRTACHRAAMFDHVELVSMIIAVGTDVNQFVQSPLETALHFKSYKSALALLQAGIKASDVDLLLVSKWPCDHSLHQPAISINDKAKVFHAELNIQQLYTCNIAEKIIRSGANVNALNYDHDTPLHFAVKEKNTALIVLLLEHRARVDVKNRLELTPLHWVQPYSNIDCFLQYALKQQHP